MSGYLLDTHIWFWYLVRSDRLPESIRQCIDTAATDCWLSPISVWELGMLNKRSRIQITGSFRDWIGQACQRFPLREASLTIEVALTSQSIQLPHRDPADHFLAATVLVYGLRLLTVDQHLLDTDWLPTGPE